MLILELPLATCIPKLPVITGSWASGNLGPTLILCAHTPAARPLCMVAFSRTKDRFAVCRVVSKISKRGAKVPKPLARTNRRDRFGPAFVGGIPGCRRRFDIASNGRQTRVKRGGSRRSAGLRGRRLVGRCSSHC